ncbi:unnamed protein product, partial [Staurois parvus]
MDPFMETNRYNVSTAVWRECPRIVINSLFLTVVGHSLHTAVETAVWSECPRTVKNRLFLTVLGHSLFFLFAGLELFLFSSYFFFFFFFSSSSSSSSS